MRELAPAADRALHIEHHRGPAEHDRLDFALVEQHRDRARLPLGRADHAEQIKAGLRVIGLGIRARRLRRGLRESGRGRGGGRVRGGGLGVGRGGGRGAGSGRGCRSGRGRGSGGGVALPRTGGEAGDKRGHQENVRCLQRSAHEAQTSHRARVTGESSLGRPPPFSSKHFHDEDKAGGRPALRGTPYRAQ
ncbi:hypothetical protein DKM19_03025 [Streptosporangium sp. 'caverna']|nr:hypothetical protein DKM19_03025 [Streptosporangium sp. 'caverna']